MMLEGANDLGHTFCFVQSVSSIWKCRVFSLIYSFVVKPMASRSLINKKKNIWGLYLCKGWQEVQVIGAPHALGPASARWPTALHTLMGLWTWPWGYLVWKRGDYIYVLSWRTPAAYKSWSNFGSSTSSSYSPGFKWGNGIFLILLYLPGVML